MKHLLPNEPSKYEVATRTHLHEILEGLMEHDADVHRRIAAIRATISMLDETPIAVPNGNRPTATSIRTSKHSNNVFREAPEPAVEQPNTGEWISTKEAAKRMGVTGQTVRQAAIRADIPSRKTRIGKTSIREYLASDIAGLGKFNKTKGNHRALPLSIPTEAIKYDSKENGIGIKQEWVIDKLKTMPQYRRKLIFTVKDVGQFLTTFGMPADYIKHGLYPQMGAIVKAGVIKKESPGHYRAAH